MGDENIVGGEAKETCLVIPCCPLSMEWDWVKYALPSLFSRCRYQTETLEMYAMLEKFIPFSQEIL